MRDPTSNLNAPPPRYLIESDSSDEEGPSSSRRSTAPAPKITIATSGPLEIDTAVLGIGQAGKYLLRGVPFKPVLEVKRGERSVGMGVGLDGGVLIGLEDGEDAFDIARSLVESLKAKTWILFSTYVPSMYIPGVGERVPSSAPVRVLSSSTETADGVMPYDAPNYVTGVAGALLSMATHPAFPVSAATLYLLPLPLSALPPASFGAALASLPPSLQKALGVRRHWDEEDDERHVAPGMGAKPRSVKPAREDLTGMYM